MEPNLTPVEQAQRDKKLAELAKELRFTEQDEKEGVIAAITQRILVQLISDVCERDLELRTLPHPEGYSAAAKAALIGYMKIVDLWLNEPGFARSYNHTLLQLLSLSFYPTILEYQKLIEMIETSPVDHH